MMGAAADAIADVVPPPTRRAAGSARDAQAEPGQMFSALLHQHAPDKGRAAKADADKSDKAADADKDKASADAVSPDQAPNPAPAPVQQQQPALPPFLTLHALAAVGAAPAHAQGESKATEAALPATADAAPAAASPLPTLAQAATKQASAARGERPTAQRTTPAAAAKAPTPDAKAAAVPDSQAKTEAEAQPKVQTQEPQQPSTSATAQSNQAPTTTVPQAAGVVPPAAQLAPQSTRKSESAATQSVAAPDAPSAKSARSDTAPRAGAARPRAAPSAADAAAKAGAKTAKSASTGASAAQPAATSANPVQAGTQAAHDEAAAQTSTRATPVAAQVGGEILRRFNGENTRFELRLDPPELGRVQVRLDVSSDHKVSAVIAADNPQALNDLSRASRDLQQALQSAGLELADNGLSFDLSGRGDGFTPQDQNSARANSMPAQQAAQAKPDETSPAPRPARFAAGWRGVRIDVMA